MKDSPIKNIFTILGCFIVFCIPVIGILAIWNFNLDEVRSSFFSLFSSESSTNYNFELQAGEDELLTSTILNDSKNIDITPRSNPAELLIIESADIEGPIVSGNDGEELLRQGFWLHPASVYPGEVGVSTIFGHRRYHLPPAKDTFYNLDKVQVGDRVEIKLQDETWLEYTVIDIRVIDPEGINKEINEQSSKSLVKFITCTPLGTSDQRLVVIAEKLF